MGRQLPITVVGSCHAQGMHSNYLYAKANKLPNLLFKKYNK